MCSPSEGIEDTMDSTTDEHNVIIKFCEENNVRLTQDQMQLLKEMSLSLQNLYDMNIDNEFTELCTALNMTIAPKLKFKTAIIKLKQQMSNISSDTKKDNSTEDIIIQNDNCDEDEKYLGEHHLDNESMYTDFLDDKNYQVQEQEYDYFLKVTLIGDAATGKSCIFSKFARDEFNPLGLATMGVEVAFIMLNIDGHVIKLHLWDTAGQEKYNSLTVSHYRGTQGCLIVFDVTNRESFDNIISWHHRLKDYDTDNCVKFIVGSKIDLDEELREVTFKEAQCLSESLGYQYIEVSAKTGQNIHRLFNTMTAYRLRRFLVDDKHRPFQSLDVTQSQQKKSCCFNS